MMLLRQVFFFLIVTLVDVVQGAGKGCIGAWQASNDIVFVADSDAVALHVVSLSRGETLERFLFLENPDLIPLNNPQKLVRNAIGIASCQTCDFAIYTSFKQFVYRINFADTVEAIIRENKSFLEGATVERLFFQAKERHDDFTMDNPRMLILEEKSSGAEGWMTEQRSNHTGLYKFELSRASTTIFTRRIFEMPEKDGYGVTMSARDKSELLVPYRRGRVDAIHRHSGEIRASFPLPDVCSRVSGKDRFIGRQAYDDPTVNGENDRVLLLQGYTYNPTWDAAVWRYNHTSGDCRFLVGRTGRTSAWVDGFGRDAQFTRVHYMILLTHIPRLLISDIDNRALRVADIPSSYTYSIMYDRDRRLQQVQQMANVTPADVVSTSSLENPPPFSLYSADLTCQSVQENRERVSANKNKPLIQVEVTSALDGTPVQVVLPTTNKDVIYDKAEEYCESVGWRLCEAVELKRAFAALDDNDNVLKNQTTWTKSECGSCWKRFSPNWCDPPPLINTKTLDILKGRTHSKVAEFRHVWNNGTAFEIGPDVAPVAVEHSITFCPGLMTRGKKKDKPPTARIACCVDCLRN